jgi:hypothetical protein
MNERQKRQEDRQEERKESKLKRNRAWNKRKK